MKIINIKIEFKPILKINIGSLNCDFCQNRLDIILCESQLDQKLSSIYDEHKDVLDALDNQ